MAVTPMIDKWFSVAPTSEIVREAKRNNGIDTPNGQMTDDEVRTVIRWIGVTFSDPAGSVEGDIILNRAAVALMLFVTICEFPEFYCRYGLSQYN
jgi:hypothetical protein